MEFLPWLGSIVFTAATAIFVAWNRHVEKRNQEALTKKAKEAAKKAEDQDKKIDANAQAVKTEFEAVKTRLDACEKDREALGSIIEQQGTDLKSLRDIIHKMGVQQKRRP